MASRVALRPAALGFWGAGCASALVVAAALLFDARATSVHRRLVVVAIVCAAVPVVRLVARSAGLARMLDASAAAGLATIGIATYPIGGLAFLLPAFFVVLAIANDRPVAAADSRNTSRLARGVLIGSLVLLALSLFSPGGAVFIVMPAAAALIVWAVATLRRRPA